MKYTVWAHIDPQRPGHRWHRQAIYGTLSEAAASLVILQRTYPDHAFCLMPAWGHLPISTADYGRLASDSVELAGLSPQPGVTY